MTTRASIILWSAASGLLLGLFMDATLIGIWMIVSSLVPSLSPRHFPRWAATIAVLLLAGLPIATAALGLFEGRLKTD